MNLIPKHSTFGGLDSFFNDNFPSFRLLPEPRMDAGNIAVDIKENDANYTVKADFPGINKDDIDISVDNNVLTISAEHKDEAEEKEGERVIRQERRYGKYSRSFNLGKNIDEGKIKAEFDNGVLTLVIPKADVAPARKQIPIK
jgi:HSP20 family protein